MPVRPSCGVIGRGSTANSQLLLAACSLCYDLFPIKMEKGTKDQLVNYEDRFLVVNRVAITVIASAALLLSHAGLPGYLMLGRISWTLVAICFFFPLFLPSWIIKEKLFFVLSTALSVQCFLVFAAGISPENAMLAVLMLEALLFKVFSSSSLKTYSESICRRVREAMLNKYSLETLMKWIFMSLAVSMVALTLGARLHQSYAAKKCAVESGKELAVISDEESILSPKENVMGQLGHSGENLPDEKPELVIRNGETR